MQAQATYTPRRALPARSPSPVGMGVSLLLCALLMLTTTWAVLAGDWVSNAGAALLVALTGVAEAALLVRAAQPRFVAILGVPLLAFAAVVPFTIGGMPVDGDPSVSHLVGRYVLAMWFPRGLFAADDWTFIVSICTVVWACAYYLTWMVVRERRGGAAVFPCFFVLAINVLNAPRSSGLLVPDTLAAATAVTVVAQANLSQLAAHWRRRRIAVLPGMVSRYVRSSAVVVLLVLAVALVAPPLSSHDFTTSILQSLRGNNGGGSGSNHTGTGSTSTAPVGFSADTTPGGPLSDANPVPMLRYSTTAPTPVYIAIAADSQFIEGSWVQGSTANGAAAPDSLGGAIDRTTNADGVGLATKPVQLYVTAIADGATSADGTTGNELAPWVGTPLSVDAPGTAVGVSRDSSSQPPLISVDRYDLDNPFAIGQTITVGGALSVATETQLRAAGSNYPAAIAAAYTAFPAGAQPDQIRALVTAWAGGAATPYDAAVAIETHLRSPQYTYTLTPPTTPSGTWPIVDFLTHTHAGYCQYFASSMAAMLRADGIPSRVVNGYANGGFSGVDSRGLDSYTVTSDDAHSWVEAYFPSYGWITFEPTPPSQLGDFQPLPRGQTSTPSANPSPGTTPAPTTRPRPTPTAGANVVAVAPPPVAPGPPVALIQTVVATLLALALAVLVVLWLARPRDLRALWRRVEFVGSLLGVRRRRSETDAGYVARLTAAIPPDTTTLLHPLGDSRIGPRPLRAAVAQALAEIAVLSGKSRFSAGGIDAKERVHWLRCWRRVIRALPHLLWRMGMAHRRAVRPAPDSDPGYSGLQ